MLSTNKISLVTAQSSFLAYRTKLHLEFSVFGNQMVAVRMVNFDGNVLQERLVSDIEAHEILEGLALDPCEVLLPSL